MQVRLLSLIRAIEQFNQSGRNPYGELKPIPGHAPLIFELRTGEPLDMSGRWPQYPSLEYEFHAKDRDPETEREVESLFFDTARTHLDPMTKAYIKRGWHRAYRYDVQGGYVDDVRLLATA